MPGQACVRTVAAMIVGDYRQPTRDRQSCKTRVSSAVFTQSMKNLDNTSSRARGPPMCAVNRVLICTL